MKQVRLSAGGDNEWHLCHQWACETGSNVQMYRRWMTIQKVMRLSARWTPEVGK